MKPGGVLYIINLKVKEWQLPQLSSDPGTVLLLESVGYVSDGSFAFVDPHVVRPVLYLTSSAKITGGETGPTGPAGPAALSTFGRKYDTTETPISLEANISQNIPLGSTARCNKSSYIIKIFFIKYIF